MSDPPAEISTCSLASIADLNKVKTVTEITKTTLPRHREVKTTRIDEKQHRGGALLPNGKGAGNFRF
jgi:hypothetical protein